ncbi:Putative GroES-like superfamily, alcohol dehydrogenase-like, NAD(P)-binding domain superfamily [Colletotrichum destructivum]|uniref:GroES-like superfamily, alcohol dehydrogenase-like, NAD(P)-binding domain superfamily n=1 Tax=Colletotrichum destructivum TaxID=34406 RepID=A0AAX4IJ97_9PEZI|nr:Putative GroES-like superfamily, alcohol dehydrogenase-like, NAD(P)-binding domain superfamily [Colletotrichum destructivum]
MPSIPFKQWAAVLEQHGKPPVIVKDRPIPEAVPGSIVVKILATPLSRYARTALDGTIPAPLLDTPFVPCPKSSRTRVQARDDPNVFIMQGNVKGPPSDKTDILAKGEFRDGALQQYQRVPLENVYRIDETLVRKLGVDLINLFSISAFSPAAGAIFESANLKACDTIIIGPSGGSFGGSAVELALAVGANVVALGRNAKLLQAMKNSLKSSRLSTVLMTGDVETDAAAKLAATPGGGGADIFNDWSPGGVTVAPFLPAAIRALKRGGRIVISGGAYGLLEVPYISMVFNKLSVEGSFMCNRESMIRLIHMIESGQLDISTGSGTQVRKFGLDEACLGMPGVCEDIP